MALQPGVGLGLRYNMPPGLPVPCSISPFVCTHLSQVHGHVIQPSHSWSSSSSCCIQLSVQHHFWDCDVLHSFSMSKPSYSLVFNRLTPNDPYMGRTVPLTSKRCILYIYSTNIGTEYFKHALYSPFFFYLQNAVCFIMLTCLFPVLFKFYIQNVLKLKKKNTW